MPSPSGGAPSSGRTGRRRMARRASARAAAVPSWYLTAETGPFDPGTAQSDWPPVEAASRSKASLSRAPKDSRNRVSRRVSTRLLAGTTLVERNASHDAVYVLAASSPGDLAAHITTDSTTHELLLHRFDFVHANYTPGGIISLMDFGLSAEQPREEPTGRWRLFVARALLCARDVPHDLIHMLAAARPCCLAANSARDCSAHFGVPFRFGFTTR